MLAQRINDIDKGRHQTMTLRSLGGVAKLHVDLPVQSFSLSFSVCFCFALGRFLLETLRMQDARVAPDVALFISCAYLQITYIYIYVYFYVSSIFRSLSLSLSLPCLYCQCLSLYPPRKSASFWLGRSPKLTNVAGCRAKSPPFPLLHTPRPHRIGNIRQ